ncbi:MAG: hypothetical protein ABSH05_27805 [Bryobacteraceae bacterium]
MASRSCAALRWPAGRRPGSRRTWRGASAGERFLAAEREGGEGAVDFGVDLWFGDGGLEDEGDVFGDQVGNLAEG